MTSRNPPPESSKSIYVDAYRFRCCLRCHTLRYGWRPGQDDELRIGLRATYYGTYGFVTDVIDYRRMCGRDCSAMITCLSVLHKKVIHLNANENVGINQSGCSQTQHSVQKSVTRCLRYSQTGWTGSVGACSAAPPTSNLQSIT